MNADPKALEAMFSSISLGAPHNAVGFVMWRVVHRYQREVDQALIGADLTHLQFVILALIAWMTRSGARATQAELARFGDIHPMQVSNVLKALEQKGKVTRTKAAAHPVAKTVSVTTTGMAALQMALPLVIEVQARLFGDEGRPGGQLLELMLRIDAGEAPQTQTVPSAARHARTDAGLTPTAAADAGRDMAGGGQGLMGRDGQD